MASTLTATSSSTRTYGEIVAMNIRHTNDLAFWAWESAEAAEAAGDQAQADAWYKEADRLFAEVEALKATI